MAETAPAQAAVPVTGAPTTSAPTNGTTTVSANAHAEQTTANRGLPYYEKLRRDLRDTIHKKRLMDKSMAQLEDQIFRFEQNYLEETTAGNIIRGFDNYIKGSSSGSSLGASGLSLGSGAGARRKAQVTESDRVFSRSSASFRLDSPGPSSAQTTPSHAATPTSTAGGNAPSNKSNVGDSGTASKASGGGGGGGSSKNKKKSSGGSKNTKGKNQTEDLSDDADSKPPVKRLKISYGRD
ncbi:hypothetical protein POX_g08682 [Penicillium oxalicum]|uniref:Chromatin modification-related protein EAF6 n=1 Tax=Penicillium oxalicum (strain 114-2 / CGMCC 5302) TaxID=933388 RepID=S7Z9W9_PENO1|nr:hypothetical protein POX_g08682 [Penicillium oxalicum]EPS27019.1 hypothetical protein PDE_01960 [Penicillium oxalicum 114-2]KAI2786299.1 hypothetical protein POX_g08682 [Penicillium oxalicum]